MSQAEQLTYTFAIYNPDPKYSKFLESLFERNHHFKRDDEHARIGILVISNLSRGRLSEYQEYHQKITSVLDQESCLYLIIGTRYNKHNNDLSKPEIKEDLKAEIRSCSKWIRDNDIDVIFFGMEGDGFSEYDYNDRTIEQFIEQVIKTFGKDTICSPSTFNQLDSVCIQDSQDVTLTETNGNNNMVFNEPTSKDKFLKLSWKLKVAAIFEYTVNCFHNLISTLKRSG